VDKPPLVFGSCFTATSFTRGFRVAPALVAPQAFVKIPRDEHTPVLLILFGSYAGAVLQVGLMFTLTGVIGTTLLTLFVTTVS
jgi:hypothetical protein